MDSVTTIQCLHQRSFSIISAISFQLRAEKIYGNIVFTRSRGATYGYEAIFHIKTVIAEFEEYSYEMIKGNLEQSVVSLIMIRFLAKCERFSRIQYQSRLNLLYIGADMLIPK
jgi:hypothetical protein